MKIEAICFALTTLTALSTAAFAASSSNPHDSGHPTTRADVVDRCSVLQSQYEAVVSGHMADPRYSAASGLHSAGVSACQSNQTAVGIQKLEQALREIGVKPIE